MSDNHSFFTTLRSSQRLLLHLVHKHNPTRAELSQLSGLTPGAITQYCRQLFAMGLLKEGAKVKGKRGLPSHYLNINPQGCYCVGVYFSQRYFDVSVIDFLGNKLSTVSLRYIQLNDFNHVLEQLCEAIDQLLSKHNIARSNILGVGYAVPGYLLKDGSRSSPWLPMLKGKSLQQMLESAVGLPAWVENNTNVIAVGHYFIDEHSQVDDMVVVSVDYGIGAGVISKGKLVFGGFGNAGEIGILYPSGSPRPTWQDLLSTLEQHHLPIEQLAILLAEQNEIVMRWLERVCQQLLYVTQSAAVWLDPALIVFSGILPDIMMDSIIQFINQTSWEDYPEDKPRPKVKYTAHYTQSASVYAAVLPIYHLLNEL